MTAPGGAGDRRETISELRVRYAETDQMGFVYHAHYLVWCDIGRTDFIRELGASYAELERGGLILAVADARLRYHASARYDDVVRVHTRLEQVRSRAVAFGYDIVRAEPGPAARLATATVSLIALDANGSPRTLPPDFRARLEAVASAPR
ncbi:MAG TPA: thioesterase family protein [Longimicrobiales bacterium]|nr:thioesterase family protein [Longimicrobiales bacterium]